MKRLVLVLAFALALQVASGSAQMPADDDPMMWAYDYAYTRAICDSATPKERAMRGRTDARVNCEQAAEMKERLKRKGYWCVTNAAADIGVPCTPGLAKTQAR